MMTENFTHSDETPKIVITSTLPGCSMQDIRVVWKAVDNGGLPCIMTIAMQWPTPNIFTDQLLSTLPLT
jgi:hypothetical protein